MAEQRTVFISSCSRRELARRRPQRSVVRRRPHRPPVRLQELMVALMAVAAVAAVLVLRGGL
jgi:hypothetical protein